MYPTKYLVVKQKRIRLVRNSPSLPTSLYAKCHRSAHFSGQRIVFFSFSLLEDRSYYKLNCITSVINFSFLSLSSIQPPPLKLIAQHAFPFALKLLERIA